MGGGQVRRIEIAAFDLSELLGPALSVMVAACGLTERSSRDRAEIFERHAARSGIIARAAFADPDRRLVGFCYGFPSDESAWWDRQVRPHLTRAGTADWLAPDTFELTELHVHPEQQGRGLGRRLITAVLRACDLPRALLSVLAGDNRARRLYASLGFRDVTPRFRFSPDQPAYTVMGATLPVAAAGPVDGRRPGSPRAGRVG